jgi:hypothetical protein
MNYSKKQLKQIANKSPEELSQIITNNISEIGLITDVLELFGDEIRDEAIAEPILKKLLKHVHATIRESALLAVDSFYESKKPTQDILDRVKAMSKTDPSGYVKECAKDLILKY